MAKGGKAQQQHGQSQKKGGGQQNLKQANSKPSRGCFGCIFGLVRKMIALVAISSFLYAITFTGYTYHVKERMPTLDEFKTFSTEAYLLGSERAIEYYGVGQKYFKVYYGQFERNYLPTIQLYTKRYTKLAVEKAGELKLLSVKYLGYAQKQIDAYYRLALNKIEEFQSPKEKTPDPRLDSESKTARPKPVSASSAERPKVTATPGHQAATFTAGKSAQASPTKKQNVVTQEMPNAGRNSAEKSQKRSTADSSEKKREL